MNKIDIIENRLMYEFPSIWAMKHKTIKGKGLTFSSKYRALAHRPWQEQILNDSHPNKVIQKARQLGMSEVSLTEILWFADMHKNTNIMYTFPTKQQMEDFSKTRVDPVLENSKRLKAKLNRNINNVSTKAIGNSHIFMRTSGNGSQGEGADIDMYCADEYDRMKAGVETAFSESLSSSDYGWIRRWSTPTIPGVGINKAYLQSDMRKYLVKCDKCGHWQQITIDNIVQIADTIDPITEEIADGTYQYRCKKCKKELNRWGKSEWVAERPNVKYIRGYFISQLNAVHISADNIKRRENSYAFKQLFYNYVLGEPYTNVAMTINETDVKTNARIPREELNRANEYIGIVAGIDWGEPTWVLVLGIRSNFSLQILSARKFFRDDTKPLFDVKQVIAHLSPYKPNLIIADAGYGADKNTELFRNFPTATYACNWSTITQAYSKKNFIDNWNEKNRTVHVDKTSKMQRTLQSVKQGQIGFVDWRDPNTQLLASHLENVLLIDKEQDGMIYQMATRKGPDHLACCLAYALIGVDKLTKYGLKISRGYSIETVQTR